MVAPRGDRAFRLYVKGSGGQRVGKTVEDLLNRATERAVRSGRLAQIKDRLRFHSKTLYLPGTSPVVARTLGSRTISEVPRSEIQELATSLGLSFDSPDVPRTIAEELGFKRLSDDVVKHINQALAYQFSTDSSEPAPSTQDAPSDLGSCGDDNECRLKRLQTILAEATRFPAAMFSEGANIMFPAGQVVADQRASLLLHGDTIWLGMWPSELAAQYQRVYSDQAKVDALIALADEPGWEVNANFHVAFRFAQYHQRWYPTRHLTGPAYMLQWMGDLRGGHAGGRTNQQLREADFRRWLLERRYADESELASLDD